MSTHCYSVFWCWLFHRSSIAYLPTPTDYVANTVGAALTPRPTEINRACHTTQDEVLGLAAAGTVSFFVHKILPVVYA